MDPHMEAMETFQQEDLGDRPTDWDGEYGYKPIGGLRARHLYDTDLEDARQGQRGRRRHFSKHELLSGDWLYIVDNDLSLTLATNTSLWDGLRQLTTTTKLCNDCSIFRLLARPPSSEVRTSTVDMSELRRDAGSCDLCAFFLRCVDRQAAVEEESIEVLRDCSVLKLGKHSQPFLDILGDPGSESPSAKTQIGLPLLPDPGSQGHFDIMRGWLDTCNQHHERYGCNLGSTSVLPTRVIDVGDGPSAEMVRLYCSQKGEQGDYVALSHCWGAVSDAQRMTFCTFQSNLNDHVGGIEVSNLPKTFRDAIRVTRELGQRYLWIDSLCIIQDDPEDWRREANTMETVYSMAYFTIAATSAQNSTQGFLNDRRQREVVKIEKPPPPPPPPGRTTRARWRDLLIEDFDWPPKYRVYTNTGTGIWRELNADRAPPEVEQFPLYICEHIDDFTADVEKSTLSSRGWVFQERALSRRILHFAATQTYWECGVGVHCETLTLMYNSESYILGDPRFPSSTSQRTDGQNIGFIESLIHEYMQRHFTQSADRSIALAGLEKRLAKAFNTEVHYGIVGKFLHRTLLWIRPRDRLLTRTCLGPGNSHKELAPSWSWMGYEGQVEFMSVGFESVAWSDAMRFQSRRELRCRMREFRNCSMIRQGDEVVLVGEGSGESAPAACVVEDDGKEDCDSIESSSPRDWLRFDVDIPSFDELRCVIIGREFGYYSREYEANCYVIIVKLRSTNGKDQTLQRLGVGLIDSKYISLEGPGMDATVV